MWDWLLGSPGFLQPLHALCQVVPRRWQGRVPSVLQERSVWLCWVFLLRLSCSQPCFVGRVPLQLCSVPSARPGDVGAALGAPHSLRCAGADRGPCCVHTDRQTDRQMCAVCSWSPARGTWKADVGLGTAGEALGPRFLPCLCGQGWSQGLCRDQASSAQPWLNTMSALVAFGECKTSPESRHTGAEARAEEIEVLPVLFPDPEGAWSCSELPGMSPARCGCPSESVLPTQSQPCSSFRGQHCCSGFFSTWVWARPSHPLEPPKERPRWVRSQLGSTASPDFHRPRKGNSLTSPLFFAVSPHVCSPDAVGDVSGP